MAAGRTATAMLLILAGVACAGFFGLLLGIADCGPDCERDGERAPVFAFIGLGVFLLVMGALMLAGVDTLRAVAWGMLIGGLLAFGATLWITIGGARGTYVWVTLAISAGDAAIGAWLAFWRPRD